MPSGPHPYARARPRARARRGLLALCRGLLAKLRPDGSFDSRFGGGDGIVKIDFPDASNDDTATAVDVAPDGRIVVGGYTRISGVQRLALTRLLPDGTLDTTFGTNGFVVEPSYGTVSDVKVRSNGGLLVTTTAFDTSSHLLRFLPDGSRDPSWGGGDGDATFSVAADSSSEGTIESHELRDGRLLVLAWRALSGNDDLAVARLNADGTLDTSYGTGGSTWLSNAYTYEDRNWTGSVVAEDGSIFIATNSVGANEDARVTKLDPTGAVVPMPAAGWTRAELAGLHMRIGNAPGPFGVRPIWDALLVEVDLPR